MVERTRSEPTDFSRGSEMEGASSDWILALLFSLFGLTLMIIAYSGVAVAQSGVTNVKQGIGDDVDKKRRGPLVTVTTTIENGTVKLLVDAFQQNKEYQDYPVQFDFFVNRQFFTSQIRSPELPGPIGIDVGPDVATPPFNYTIVAKVLHPNRTFTTVYTAAAFSSNLVNRFDCTLTITNPAMGDEDESTSIFVANDVSTNQTSNSSVTLSFMDIESENGDEEVDLNGSFTISGDTDVTGTLSIARNDSLPTSVSVEGIIEREDGSVTALDVGSADETVELSCS